MAAGAKEDPLRTERHHPDASDDKHPINSYKVFHTRTLKKTTPAQLELREAGCL